MKILLIEDSRVLRERLGRMIDAIPAAELVAQADNEGDAQSYLAKYRPDVVVLDLRLRRGSGLSLLEHIKATYPRTLVVVLTNYGQPEYRAKCLDLGADYFFDKSVDIEAFNELLASLTLIELAT